MITCSTTSAAFCVDLLFLLSLLHLNRKSLNGEFCIWTDTPFSLSLWLFPHWERERGVFIVCEGLANPYQMELNCEQNCSITVHRPSLSPHGFPMRQLEKSSKNRWLQTEQERREERGSEWEHVRSGERERERSGGGGGRDGPLLTGSCGPTEKLVCTLNCVVSVIYTCERGPLIQIRTTLTTDTPTNLHKILHCCSPITVSAPQPLCCLLSSSLITV